MRLLRQAGTTMAWAPAKVNPFLELLGKRADGYHEIATAMVAVGLYDVVLAEDIGAGVVLTCNRPDLSVGPDNLVLQAAQLLRDRTGVRRGVHLRLTKRIPWQAGLGGGSSDAAAALAVLDLHWGLGLKEAELAGLVAELGSDVPFFLRGAAAWCTGRGEIVEPLKLGRPLDLVLIAPPFGCSTAEVYRRAVVPAETRDGEEVRAALAQGDVEGLGRLLFNRLEEPACRLQPSLAERLESLGKMGPAGRLVSGSGSCLLALCRSAAESRKLARAWRQDPARTQDKVFVVRSCA